MMDWRGREWKRGMKEEAGKGSRRGEEEKGEEGGERREERGGGRHIGQTFPSKSAASKLFPTPRHQFQIVC